MPEARIPLADTIEAVRHELAQLVESSAGKDIQFPVGEVSLAFQVGVTKSGEGSAGVHFWVFEVGARGSHSRETMQTITITLGAPVDPLGRSIRVASGSSEKP